MSSGKNILSIVKNKICCGCGGCVIVCPKNCISIIEGRHFNYANLDNKNCVNCGLCLRICPSNNLLTPELQSSKAADNKNLSYNCYLTYSCDSNIRKDGASGGFVTALLISLLRNKDIDGAIVVRADKDNPIRFESFLAGGIDELFKSMGSCYSPVSVCLALRTVLEKPGKYAFVGKPCEVYALKNLQNVIPVLKERIKFVIGLFCAQTPSRSRTYELIEHYGVNPSDITKLKYRGNGWPGKFVIQGSNKELVNAPYLKAWRFLASGRIAIRCLLCFDKFSEMSDLSVGDPRGEKFEDNDKNGKTVVVVRNETGKHLLEIVGNRGDIVLESYDYENVLKNQRSLKYTQNNKKSFIASFSFFQLGKIRFLPIVILTRARLMRSLIKAKLMKEYY